ncbi:enoyl-CoA hydratase/isomerase family protein [Pseudomonas sp. Marseille-Q7302]
MSDAKVLLERRGGVGYLTLDRPAGLNALDLEMVRSLHGALRDWEGDPGVRVVVLRGNGPKAFCAGGDVRALYDSYQRGDDLHQIFFTEEYALDLALHRYPKPVLALANGLVLGGGMGLVQAARLRIVSERTRMAMPETAIGYFPDVGASHFLPRLPDHLGLYLGLTGEQIGPADALAAGLADVFVPEASNEALAQRLEEATAQGPIDLAALLQEFAGAPAETARLTDLRPAIAEHFAAATVEELRGSLQAESRPAYRDWAQETLATLDRRSPLAVATALELLRQGSGLSLEQCFALELHLDRRWFEKGEIVEGVRAMLVDKDRTPHWNPARWQDLDPRRVAAFFTDFRHS